MCLERTIHKGQWSRSFGSVTQQVENHPLSTGRVLDVPPLQPIPRTLPPCGCGTPGLAAADSCYCAVDDVLRIIRRRYSLSVLNVIRARGAVRYTEIAGALQGVSSSTLSETLLALETAQLVTRTDLTADGAPRTQYALTPSGEKLVHKLRVLLEEIQQSG